jgi:uncharacterized membrane protein YqjE
MMDAPASPQATVTTDPPGAARGLIAALFDALHTRLELLGVEVEIHLRALLRMLIWAFGAVACAVLALAFGLLTLIAALWNTHRTVALLGGTLVFIALAVIFGFFSARALRARPEVLQDSLGQLAEDERRTRGAP